MALGGMTFGAVNSDRVVCAANAALDNLSTWTGLVWFKQTGALSGGMLLFGKGAGSSSNVRLELRTANTSGAVRVLQNWTGGGGVSGYDSANGVIQIGQNCCIGVTFDAAGSAGNRVAFHSSVNGAPLAKLAYGSITEGVGSLQADTGVALTIGNNTPAGSPTSAFQGVIYAVAISGAVLTLAEMEAWKQNPDQPIRGELGRWMPGNDAGLIVMDRSRYRAHGVVTGAKVSAHRLPAVVLPFRRPGADTPTGISGSLSTTLGAVTATATGTVSIAGSLSSTLGAVTASATGAVAIAGAATATLGAVTASATGTLALSGALSSTLGAVTASATGALDIAGSLSSTLGAVTVAGAGTLVSGGSGTLANTLGAVSVSASGALALSGAVSSTLGAVTATATGALAISGALTGTLGAASLAASGSVSGGTTPSASPHTTAASAWASAQASAAVWPISQQSASGWTEG